MFAVFLLQDAVDFPKDRRALERMLGADHHQRVIMSDGGVNLSPGGAFWQNEVKNEDLPCKSLKTNH
jgi:hypothetical protein